MATQTGETGLAAQWWRWGGVFGIGWIILFVIGNFLLIGASPSRDDSLEDIRKYFAEDGDMYLAGDYVAGIAFVFFFLPFVVILSRVLRAADGLGQVLSTLVVVGGLAGTLIGATGALPWGTLALSEGSAVEKLTDEDVRMLNEMNSYGFAQLGLGLALFWTAVSLAIWRTGALWRWLAPLGAIVAILLLISAAWPIDGDEEGALATVGFIGFPGTLIMMLLTSVGLLMRQTPPDEAAA